ncbi:MAG: hypothetical protein ACOC9Q_01175 [bacterium]
MRRSLLGAMATVAALTLLPGSAVSQSTTGPTVAPLAFVFHAQPIDDALSSSQALEDALDEFNVPRPANANQRQWINAIRQDSDRLKNVAGIPGHAMLKAALRTLGPVSGNYEQAVKVASFGEILDYEFDKANNSGVLEVATYYYRTKGASPTSGPVTLEGWRFRVTVDPLGFSVIPKTPTDHPDYDPDDVFPGTIPISEDKALGLEYKLWAKGTAINVTEVWRDPSILPGQSANWVPVQNAGPFAKLYMTDESSCVDMMFAVEPPATWAPNLPYKYCLGRCDSPLIINTM